MTTNLCPTHTCFDDALDLMTELVEQDRKHIDTLFLVHGLCRMPVTGALYAHAWLEEGDDCLFIAALDPEVTQRKIIQIKQSEFNRLYRIVERHRYSVEQTLKHNFRTNHYGPWEPHLEALCRNPNKPRDSFYYVRQGDVEGIHCVRCDLSSFNPHDVAERYCGKCKQFLVTGD